jgi:signal peptidase II
MTVLSATLLAVFLSDQAIKLLLRHRLGDRAIALGAFGNVRTVVGRLWLRRLWLRRLGPQWSGAAIWCVWLAAAIALVIGSLWVPSSGAFAGLLLGGSLSHAVESSLNGRITDYICLKFWPAFDLADVAMTAGAIGTVATHLITKCATVF